MTAGEMRDESRDVPPHNAVGVGSVGEDVRFAAVSEVTPAGQGRFESLLSPEWTIGGKPNGGYLLAIMGRAATTAGPHPHVIAASGHFMRPPAPGPVVIDTEVLRAGRSASQIRARLSQGEEACVEALITTSELRSDTIPYWSGGVPEPGRLSFDECKRLTMTPRDGMRVAIMEHVGVRFEPGSAGFTRGEPSGAGELRGWLALPKGEDFDSHSLVYAVDGYPPATFDIEYAGWVPTLELTAYVRALPAPGPVRILQRAVLIEDRRVDEACFIWDARGRLVATGTQLAGIRLG
jgi:acyl-coenzyme A thioesterase PaaI-like protein